MLVYRIVFKQFSQSLFAPGLAGRWNGAGRKVLYTAESIPLAFMENMIRRKGTGFNDGFHTMVIEVPDDFGITIVHADNLSAGWRNYKDYAVCQAIGNAWFDEVRTPVLRVPSAVLPDANNYVLNTLHLDFKRVRHLKSIPLLPDERIEAILRAS